MLPSSLMDRKLHPSQGNQCRSVEFVQPIPVHARHELNRPWNGLNGLAKYHGLSGR